MTTYRVYVVSHPAATVPLYLPRTTKKSIQSFHVVTIKQGSTQYGLAKRPIHSYEMYRYMLPQLNLTTRQGAPPECPDAHIDYRRPPLKTR